MSLFSEKKCYDCGQIGHFFCPSCQETIQRYSPYCYVCKKLSRNFLIHEHCKTVLSIHQIIVLTRYRQNPIKKALKQAKYYGKYPVYEDIINVLGKDILLSGDLCFSGVLVPVPLHFSRKWKRGYNQAEKIAGVFSQILGLSVDTKLIFRGRRTRYQSHLSLAERLTNLTGAFKVYQNTYPKDTTLYLVDDVISTGSTLQEISITLQQAGFHDIRALVIASD